MNINIDNLYLRAVSGLNLHTVPQLLQKGCWMIIRTSRRLLKAAKGRDILLLGGVYKSILLLSATYYCYSRCLTDQQIRLPGDTLASAVTKVGVTRGQLTVSHNFFLKKTPDRFLVIVLCKVMTFFSCCLVTTPTFRRRLSSVRSKFSHRKIISFGCHHPGWYHPGRSASTTLG